ncbi:MAG: RDD family protein [Corynebacterium sp.]|nr:RDD family protein [Corynebacterium sp.]
MSDNTRQPRRSWLDGPELPSQNQGTRQAKWPGELLGLPKKGPGALGSVMRRAGGVFIDWCICLIIANFIVLFTNSYGSVATLSYIVFFFLGSISVMIFARTPGQAILGMGVARVDQPGTRVGVWRAIVRTLLTLFFFPAAIVDSDGRGLHDRSTGTAVILSR